MSGRIEKLFLKVAHGQPMQAVDRAIAETGMGLVGDVSFGRSKRQVLFIEDEVLKEFGLSPGDVRENVTVSGIDLAGSSDGTLVQVGEVLFEVIGDCAPCQFIEEIQPGLREAMSGRRGTLCRVLDGGTIQVGDRVTFVT